MRPSEKPTGAVWELLLAWKQDHPLRPNQSQMAGLFGVSSSLLSNWKYMESRMQTDDMQNISDKTGIAYEDLARAVSADMPSILINIAARPAAARHGRSTGRSARDRQDADATAPDEPGGDDGA